MRNQLHRLNIWLKEEWIWLTSSRIGASDSGPGIQEAAIRIMNIDSAWDSAFSFDQIGLMQLI